MSKTRAAKAAADTKTQANANRVAERNAADARTARADLAYDLARLPKWTRDDCLSYLAERGLAGGHSRSSIAALRLAVGADMDRLLGGAPTPPDAAEVLPSPDPAPQAEPDPIKRLALAKAEHRTLQAWIKDGENPPRPATPNLDAVNADHAAGVKPTAKKAAKAPRSTTVVATLPEGTTEGQCIGCQQVLPAAKFPKAVVGGKRQPHLRAAECRACRDARRQGATTMADAC